jgi:N6-L-threonylcarbamoyladenine synthase
MGLLAMKPRWKDTRVVQDQAVARPYEAVEVGKNIVVEVLVGARQHQHSRIAALSRRLLRDQIFGQLIIEVRNLHQITILGIESSCDETAAAVLRDERQILSSVVASQLPTHSKYGGVVPELASREHLRAIVPVVREALGNARVDWEDLDAIAVTQGPGLLGSLLVGVTYAKAICFARKLPLIAVNHVEGHIHSVLLEHPQLKFPALALVVSGGHTHLFEVPEAGRYRLLGKTRDDAAGEAFDKVGKLLGFPYPGGPLIDLLAPYGNPVAVRFTPAKMKGNQLDFSFSGLKTAVLRWTEQNDIGAEVAARRTRHAGTLDEWRAVTPQKTLDLVASFQHTVIRELLQRAVTSAEQMGAESIIVAGGVACNAGLRAGAAKEAGLNFYFPTATLSTDNAAMIAAAAFPKYERSEFADFDLRAQASLPLA